MPPDLACFATLLRRFGVRPSFGPSDFCHALRRLAVETGAAQPVTSPAAASSALVERKSAAGGVVGSLAALAGYGGGAGGGGGAGAGAGAGVEAGDGATGVRVGRELTPAQVELAVAMVQVSRGVVFASVYYCCIVFCGRAGCCD